MRLRDPVAKNTFGDVSGRMWTQYICSLNSQVPLIKSSTSKSSSHQCSRFVVFMCLGCFCIHHLNEICMLNGAYVESPLICLFLVTQFTVASDSCSWSSAGIAHPPQSATCFCALRCAKYCKELLRVTITFLLAHTLCTKQDSWRHGLPMLVWKIERPDLTPTEHLRDELKQWLPTRSSFDQLLN